MSELRVNRLAEQIKKEITYVLATKVKNHDLGFVTVTEVALTGDYSQAKVFYTVLGGEKEKEKRNLFRIKGNGFCFFHKNIHLQNKISNKISHSHKPRTHFR